MGQLLQQNMDQFSVNDKISSVQRTLNSLEHGYTDDVNLFRYRDDHCKLRLVFTVPGDLFGLAFHKGFPYQQFFNQEIRKMKANGGFYKIKRRHYKMNEDCTHGQVDQGSISLKKVVSAFLILLTGIFLSLTICSSEILINKKR